MHKLLVLYPHPVSPEAFRRHYLETHLPLVAQLPGLRASWHSFDVNGVAGESPYFCVWQGEFESAAAMVMAMESETGRQVAADGANYATGGMLVLHMPMDAQPDKTGGAARG